ncbi:Plug domain-containing protein, partial [Burkholderia gladioli]|uniref:Plug domain-containing protein n=1 Tax=Burkholderia gladioli TaxID=28095 RepID=UPI000D43F5FB
MIRPSRIAIAMAGALSALSASAAVSQTTDAASEPPATPLPSISVKASANASPTSLGSEALKRRLDQTVGSVGFVDAASYTNSYAFTLRDVLKDAPGVFVENRYGQELRLSIRGSGIARGYHARGLDILQDGIPTNLADGSGDYYQIDPLGLQATQIYNGGIRQQYGPTTQGGANNYVTPTPNKTHPPNKQPIK